MLSNFELRTSCGNGALERLPKRVGLEPKHDISATAEFRSPKTSVEKRVESTGFGPLVEGPKVRDHDWYSVDFEFGKSDRKEVQNSEDPRIWSPARGPEVSRS